MNFANVKGLTIPQGKVTKIELLKDSMRTLLWQAIRYLKGYTIGGNAEVKDGRIVGVGDEFAWNQLVEDGTMPQSSLDVTWINNNRYPKEESYEDGIYHLVTRGSESSFAGRVTMKKVFVKDHKMLIQGVYHIISGAAYLGYASQQFDKRNPASGFVEGYWIGVSGGDYPFMALAHNGGLVDMRVKYIQVFDLTAMGIADRINSLEDFKTYLKSHSMMDKDATEIPYFGYDAGSVKTSLPIVASNQSGSESTTYPLLVSSPLYKAGSVADVAKFGQGVTRKMGKKVFDGTERVLLFGWLKKSETQGALYGYDADVKVNPNRDTPANIQANTMQSVSYNRLQDSDTPNLICVAPTTNYGFVIRIPNTFATAESWQAHLADLYAQGNPLTIIYELAEPTTEAVDLPKVVDYQPTILTTDTEVQGDITIEE